MESYEQMARSWLENNLTKEYLKIQYINVIVIKEIYSAKLYFSLELGGSKL